MPSQPGLRKIISSLGTMILRSVVGRTADASKFSLQQVRWLADRVSDEVEYFQAQGSYFRPIEGAEGLMLTVAGDKSSAVLALATKRDTSPGGGAIAEGEGGLYYAGEFKVFLDAAGIVNLGAKAGAQFVALADDVRAQLDGIESTLDDHADKIDNHIHITTATIGAGGTPGVISPTATPTTVTYTPATPAATKTKAT